MAVYLSVKDEYPAYHFKFIVMFLHSKQNESPWRCTIFSLMNGWMGIIYHLQSEGSDGVRNCRFLLFSFVVLWLQTST